MYLKQKVPNSLLIRKTILQTCLGISNNACNIHIDNILEMITTLLNINASIPLKNVFPGKPQIRAETKLFYYIINTKVQIE